MAVDPVGGGALADRHRVRRHHRAAEHRPLHHAARRRSDTRRHRIRPEPTDQPEPVRGLTFEDLASPDLTSPHLTANLT